MAKKNGTRANKKDLRSIGGARPGFKRATYYLTPELIKRLKIRAATDVTDASSVVRAALEAFL